MIIWLFLEIIFKCFKRKRYRTSTDVKWRIHDAWCCNFITALDIFISGGKYEPILLNNNYKVHMKLTIHSVNTSDYGSYKCVSRNSLGDTDGSINVYGK